MALGPPVIPPTPGPLPPLPSPPVPPLTSLNVFPPATRISWSVHKTPNWATRMQRSVVGRELTISDYAFPLYSLTLNWEVLRDYWDRRGPILGNTVLDELRQIWNFYNQQLGPAIPFAYFDVTDNTTRPPGAGPTNFIFARGDGMTTEFQALSRLLAPVVPNVITSVNVGGSFTGAYSIDGATGIITFASPPGDGFTIGWDATYFYRVRFNTDGLEAENFAYQFWQMKQMKLISKAY